MEYTREQIIDGINKKLDRWSAENIFLQTLAETYRPIMLQYPDEIEQNIIEWINDEPLSEVDCHGMSIKRIMDGNQLAYTYFPILVGNFVAFEKSNFQNALICYRYI